MARMTLSSGSCPICGRNVARTMTSHHGLLTEAYHCPVHGRRPAAPNGLTVAEWAMPTMPAIAEMLGVPVRA
jgi:hypothetical protein